MVVDRGEIREYHSPRQRRGELPRMLAALDGGECDDLARWQKKQNEIEISDAIVGGRGKGLPREPCETGHPFKPILRRAVSLASQKLEEEGKKEAREENKKNTILERNPGGNKGVKANGVRSK